MVEISPEQQIMQILDNWHEKIGEICKCGVLDMVKGWEIGCQIPGPEKKEQFFLFYNTIQHINNNNKKRNPLWSFHK